MSSGSLLQIVESEEQESVSWIVTFADMMMLVLVFFILRYTLFELKMKRIAILSTRCRYLTERVIRSV